MSILTVRSSTFIALAVALSITASVFLLSPGTSAAQTIVGPMVWLEPSAPDIALPGQRIPVEVWSRTEDAAAPAGWSFNLSYDPSKVDVIDVRSLVPAVSAQGDPLPPCAFAWHDHGDYVSIATVCNQPLIGHHPLAELQFQILPNAQPGDVLDFGVFDSEVGNFNLNDPQLIDSVGLDTSVLIIGGVCGDQNDDAKVDIFDAILDFKFAIGLEDPTPVQAYLSDLDGIGGINVVDVIILLQHIVGIVDIERIGCGPLDGRLGSIHGYKFNDTNMNGLWDDGEPAMAGWTVKLWEPRDGGRDFVAETMTMEDNPSTTWDETGMYWFQDVPPGDYVVTEEERPGWHQSWPASHYAGMSGGNEVGPVNTSAWGDAAFNLIQNDQDDTWWIKFGVRWDDLSSPPTGLHVHRGEEGENGPIVYDLATAAGLNPANMTSPVSGMFQLVDMAEPGPVSKQIDLLNSGEFYVNLHSENNLSGEIRGQIYPMGRHHFVSVYPRQTVEHVDFGNWTENPPGSIHGAKWLDENGNGVAEASEPRLAGIKIELVDENGTVVRTVHTMADDPTTNEDEQGWFWIDDVPAGQYTLREYPGDMIPTWPSANLSRLRGDNQYSQTGSQGGALVTFVDDMEGGIWYKVWMGEDLQGTSLDIHIHDSVGILLDLEEKAGLTVSDPLPDNFRGMFTAADIGISLDDFWSMANSGELYVNLHTTAFAGGEVAGGIESRGHQNHTVWLEPGQEETFLFGNKPGPEPEDDPCGCIIGIFEDDQTHDWWVRWNSDATTVVEDLMVKVVASSVNSAEAGSIIATIDYGDGSSDNVSVNHPTGTDATTDPDNVGWLDIDESKIVPGQNYLLTITKTGTAHHYKLGWKHGQEDDLWLGTNDIKYHEGVTQHWGVDADVNETVEIDFVTDDPNMGANQTSEIEVEIVDPSGTTIYGPTSLTLAPNTPETVSFTALMDGMYVVKMVQNQGPGAGHFRVVRQGTDAHLWLLPCPEQDEPHEHDGSIHGFKYEDLNGNGVRDAGEPGVPGVTITAVGPNGVTRTTTTMDDQDTSDGDMTGWFWLEDLATGDWVVTETVPAGWVSTTPVSQTVHVEADTGADALTSHNEFDCGYTLYVANEGNGGGGETIVAVDCEGNVSPFANGFNGTSGLAVNAADEMFASDDTPNAGIYSVDMAGNVTTIAAGHSASNPNALSIDSSGRILVGDSGQRILRLTLDSLNNLVNEEVLADTFQVPQGVIQDPATGDVLFTDASGDIFVITPLDVLPVTPSTVSTSYAINAPANEGNLVMDAAGNLYASDFNDRIIRLDANRSTFKDVVDLSDAPCPPNQLGRDRTPGFRGFVFDTEGDLVATGYCEDEIYIFQADDLQNAWDTNTPISTLPAPFAENPGLDGILNGPFGMVFKVGAPDPNPDDPDVTFGNKRVPGDDGEIVGRKWEDLNGDGVQDAGESGLAGVTIYVDTNNNNILDTGEPTTVTNAIGYSFTNVPVGTHTVREVVPTGFSQTFPPAPGAHTVTLTAGQQIGGIDFGNQRESTQEEWDFGDAPDSYSTLEASSGPKHIIDDSGPFLGDNATHMPDAESDGQPTASVDGDDNDGNDDENTPIWALMRQEENAVGTTGTVDVTYTAIVNLINGGPVDGVLDGWIDLDQSGTFDTSEHFINGETLVSSSGSTTAAKNFEFTWTELVSRP